MFTFGFAEIDFIDFKSKELCASGHKNKQEI